MSAPTELPDATLWWPFYAAICEAELSYEELRGRPTLWTLWLVTRIDAEVRNGTWSQLFWNLRHAPIEGPDYIAALEAIGATEAAALCARMLARLDRSAKQRAAFFASDYWDQPAGLKRAFSQGARRYYALDPSVRVQLDEWIRTVADDPDIRAFAERIEPFDAFNARSPLHVAADEGNHARVERLLAAGAELDAGDDDADTALHLAARAGESASHLAIVADLLAAGADPDKANSDGERPLLSAAGSKAFTAALLAGGADPDATDPDGDTALHRVEDRRVARLLLKAGADVDARNANGQTPLMRAALRCSLNDGAYDDRQLMTVLIRAGARPAVDAMGRDVYWYACDTFAGSAWLRAEGFAACVEADEDGRHGYTALHRAAGAGDNDRVKLLIEQGFDPNVRLRAPLEHPPAPAGATPVDVAKAAGKRGTARVLAARGGEPAAVLDDQER